MASSPKIIDATCSLSECKEKGTYELPVFCLNCGWRGILRRTKGHLSSLITDECPMCECAQLERA